MNERFQCTVEHLEGVEVIESGGVVLCKNYCAFFKILIRNICDKLDLLN